LLRLQSTAPLPFPKKCATSRPSARDREKRPWTLSRSLALRRAPRGVRPLRVGCSLRLLVRRRRGRRGRDASRRAGAAPCQRRPSVAPPLPPKLAPTPSNFVRARRSPLPARRVWPARPEPCASAVLGPDGPILRPWGIPTRYRTSQVAPRGLNMGPSSKWVCTVLPIQYAALLVLHTVCALASAAYSMRPC
jgi:hypothetical protein